MLKIIVFLAIGALILTVFKARTAIAADTDTIKTSEGPLTIGFVGHGSVYFQFKGMTIQVDPYSEVGDYSVLPKADMVLITHEHYDHLDLKALALTTKPGAPVVTNAAAGAQVSGAKIMKNGDKLTLKGINIEAMPAYNMVHKRPDGEFFHPQGVGNGYVLTFGDKRVYVAGDTEDIPEMAALSGIDIAFIPVNLPYTMNPEMAVHATKLLKAKILYPYHTGDTDMVKLAALLKKTAPETDVRIRPMQ